MTASLRKVFSSSKGEKQLVQSSSRIAGQDVENGSVESVTTRGVPLSTNSVHRALKPRHIQLIGIGGTIGTVLFVGIGRTLIAGGPASLLIAFIFWCTVVAAVTNCLAEMVSNLPISAPFIRFAGRYVDPAFGVATGWNFFLFQAILVPFEIVAINLVLQYWTTKIPVAVVIVVILLLYVHYTNFSDIQFTPLCF